MCGIFGVLPLAPRRPLDADVDAALAALHHRGPDANGIYRSADVALGHTRLAVLDLTPGGAQPMRSADDAVVVTFNGEIYNHHELRNELTAAGHQFRSRSDTEVIVEGYRAWGEAVVGRLDGMFAFGIYDRPAGTLLLARDRVGKKPLFYALHEGALYFASEVKALIAAGVPAEVNVASLPFILSFGYAPAPMTPYRGVEQLPPGHTLIVTRGGAPAVRRYWRAPFVDQPSRVSDAEATARVRDLVTTAVGRRLEADVPLGAFLSGGVDSTVVVGLMARVSARPVKTFSIGFVGDPRYDETSYARAVAKRFGTDHTEFHLDPTSFDLAERLVDLYDGPFADASAIPTSVVSMLTRRHVTVALSGDGGDELFCGYSRLVAAEASERVPPALRAAARAAASVALPGRIADPGARSRRERLARFVRVISLPLGDRLAAWSTLTLFDLDRALRPEASAASAEAGVLAWSRSIADESRGATALSRVLAYNFATYLPDDLLVKADRASMMHSLEVRSPLLDTALIEYVARLPDRLKRRGRVTKWVFKRAFADLLPPAVVARKKMGFAVPLGAWFAGDLREYVRERLLAPEAHIYTYLERRYVESLVTAHLGGRGDWGFHLWTLLTLEIWLRSLAAKRTSPARRAA